METLVMWMHFLLIRNQQHSCFIQSNLVKLEMIKIRDGDLNMFICLLQFWQSINPKGINIMADLLSRAYYSTVDSVCYPGIIFFCLTYS